MVSAASMSLPKPPLLVASLALGAACATPPPHGAEASHAHGRAEKVHHHRFTGAEAWAARFDDPARAAWQKPEHVVELLELAAGMVVADVGAGTGYFEPFLSRSVAPGGRVLALDVEPDMVRWMEARAAREGWDGVEPREVPADDPRLDPGSVDRVLVVDTWHHVAGRAAYAGKLFAALRPGGSVLVVDFTAESPEGPPPAMRLTAEEVSAELAAVGFSIEVLAESLPHQYAVRARR